MDKIPLDSTVVVIVAYDIKDDKKRGQVSKLLESFGERVQYSVFECILNKKSLATLRQMLSGFTLEEGESIIIYTIRSAKYLEKWRKELKERFKSSKIVVL